MTDELLTREALAALLHVTPRTLHNYQKAKLLPEPLRVGRRLLWPRAVLLEFLHNEQAKAQAAA